MGLENEDWTIIANELWCGAHRVHSLVGMCRPMLLPFNGHHFYS